MTDRLDEAARAACNTYAAEMMAPGMSYDGFNERVKGIWRAAVKAALAAMQEEDKTDWCAVGETHEQRWRRLGFPFKWSNTSRAYEYVYEGEKNDYFIDLPTVQAVDEWIAQRIAR